MLREVSTQCRPVTPGGPQRWEEAGGGWDTVAVTLVGAGGPPLRWWAGGHNTGRAQGKLGPLVLAGRRDSPDSGRADDGQDVISSDSHNRSSIRCSP